MKKMAVIGDADFNVGFRLVGIRDIYDVSSQEELERAVKETLSREDVGVVVIRYDLIKQLPYALQREVDESVDPTFVAVGGEGGVEEIREKIRRAIGVDLWK